MKIKFGDKNVLELSRYIKWIHSPLYHFFVKWATIRGWKWRAFLHWEKKIMQNGAKGVGVTNWDEDSDIYSWLIAKLTCMGVKFWNWGISIDHKKVAHECWEVRSHLVNFVNAEDRYRKLANDAYKVKYGFYYDLIEIDYDKFIQTGFVGAPSDNSLSLGIDPRLFKGLHENYTDTKAFRTLLVESAKEAEKWYFSVRYGVDRKSSVKSYNSEVYGNAETKKAFDLMRRNWEKWWD